MTDSPYVARRERLMDQLGEGLAIVRGRGPEGVNPNFLYLTGVAEPSAVLLLAPGGARVGTGRLNPGPDYVRGKIARQVLFLPSADPLAARWGEDAAATVETVTAAALGVDSVFKTGDLDSVLTPCLQTTRKLSLVRGALPSLVLGPDHDAGFAETVRNRFLGLQIEDATPIVHEMRRLKDAGEVAAIERAIEVTAEALRALVVALGQGKVEHELEAEIARVYRAHGGTHAFDPIVAGGANALKLHYQQNIGPIRPGELLLVDTGVSLGGYKSDITRTVPVDGKFTTRQCEIYEVVLRAQREAIQMCRPGSLLGDVHARSFEVIADAGFADDFPHGIGHHLGLETHDVGDVHQPLAPGAVVTIEPGIYVAADGIGVRIEDDVLVTEDGPRVLSESIPREVEAVERWVTGG